MAKAQRVTNFNITLDDKPGTLLAIAKDLKSKNVGLVGLMGHGTPTGQAEVYLIAKTPDKLRNAWKSSGVIVKEETSFFVKGADKTGALVKSLEAIAQAGVNITSIDAIAVSGNYGFIVRVAPADVEKTGKALGAK